MPKSYFPMVTQYRKVSYSPYFGGGGKLEGLTYIVGSCVVNEGRARDPAYIRLCCGLRVFCPGNNKKIHLKNYIHTIFGCERSSNLYQIPFCGIFLHKFNRYSPKYQLSSCSLRIMFAICEYSFADGTNEESLECIGTWD